MTVTPAPDTAARLAALRDLALTHPDGLVDCTIGSPCDAVPTVAVDAAAQALSGAAGYPMSPGSPDFRAAWSRYFARRFGANLAADAIAACPGTKELIASLPTQLRVVLGDTATKGRDTVLLPGLAYTTYADGAAAAGCRPVRVPVDGNWQPDLAAIAPDDASRALLLWLNTPANPTGVAMDRAQLDAAIAWARERGIVVASDECYLDLVEGAPTALAGDGHDDGVLAVHSLSKRSNFAGMRAGCYAGDAQLVAALAALRRTLGLIVPTPIQAGAIAALDDHEHVLAQRARYETRRRAVLAAVEPFGVVHDGGAMPFYLWLRGESRAGGGAVHDGGWALAERFARAGWLVTPGATFGAAGAEHVRLALVQPDDVLARAAERFMEREGR
ncbi:MAG TPA: aminotransferase class I/II-fold pyridoxal phosphate-dependent enzyme [Acidimicrobiia bacterium]